MWLILLYILFAGFVAFSIGVYIGGGSDKDGENRMLTPELDAKPQPEAVDKILEIM